MAVSEEKSGASAPPAPAPGRPRRSPQSGWARGCSPASSSPAGSWCPESSGRRTLQACTHTHTRTQTRTRGRRRAQECDHGRPIVNGCDKRSRRHAAGCSNLPLLSVSLVSLSSAVFSIYSKCTGKEREARCCRCCCCRTWGEANAKNHADSGGNGIKGVKIKADN